jgi:hypothetical protein
MTGVVAAGFRKHAFTPDHIGKKGKANGPEEDETKNHGGDPGTFALTVQPGFGPGQPTSIGRQFGLIGGGGHVCLRFVSLVGQCLCLSH